MSMWYHHVFCNAYKYETKLMVYMYHFRYMQLHAVKVKKNSPNATGRSAGYC